jgi:hypothetical protein
MGRSEPKRTGARFRGAAIHSLPPNDEPMLNLPPCPFLTDFVIFHIAFSHCIYSYIQSILKNVSLPQMPTVSVVAQFTIPSKGFVTETRLHPVWSASSAL